uniref:tRNA pseudouridine synthase n=1 Tax=Plectus sambesii TaxID=2011161 RepID=A0A914X1G0_9BILA
MGSSGRRRYLIWIAYAGGVYGRFNAMAKHPKSPSSVMSLLERVISETLRIDWRQARISPSSRTDAGVHALRNAVTADLPVHFTPVPSIRDPNDCTQWKKCWNEALEDYGFADSLKILDVHPVATGFNGRYHVAYRKYVYRLCVENPEVDWASTLSYYGHPDAYPHLGGFGELNHSWRIRPPFDVYKARQACALFKGEQNVASFYPFDDTELTNNKIPGWELDTMRYFLSVSLDPGQPYCKSRDPVLNAHMADLYHCYNFTVVARSFVKRQIRRMMSWIVAIASGKRTVDDLKWLLDNPHPSHWLRFNLKDAPAHGLYLTDVVYDPRMYTDPVPQYQLGWDLSPPPHVLHGRSQPVTLLHGDKDAR